MSIQSAITTELSVAKEQSQGVLAPGAKFRKLERVSGGLSLEKDTYSSARIASDRQKSYSRHGVRRAAGQVRDELSIGGSDMFLEGAVGGLWVNGVTKTAAAATVDDLGTIVATAGAFNGIFPGLTVEVEGFAEGTVIGRVIGVSDNGDTVIVSKPEDAAWAEEADAAITVKVVGRTLRNGKVDNSYTFDAFYPEIAGAKKYLRSVGVKVDSTAFDLPPTGLASVTYTLRGLNQTTEATAADASPLEPVAGSLLAAVNGAALVDNESAGLITALSFNTANGLAGDPVVGSNFVPKLFDGAFAVTGSATVYMESMDFITKFDEEDEISLVVVLAGDEANTFLSVILPRVKINSATVTADGTGGATIAINWEALKDAFTGSTLVFQSSFVPA